MQTQRTTRQKATLAPFLLALVLVLTTLVVAPASAQDGGEGAQSGQYPTEVRATGVLERAAPHDPDPTPIYAITDEATSTPYELTSGFVELEPFVGERVTITGVPVPGDPPAGAPVFVNVTSIAPADDQGGGQPVVAAGLIEPLEATSFGYGTHAITDEASGAPYALTSEIVDLDAYVGEQATIYGALVPGYEDGLDGGPPLVGVYRVEVAPPDAETYGLRGTITSISGSAVLVEEDPSEEGSGDKGYFTVTDETEITEQQEGERVPAAFEDLEVGQLVEAAYAGPVAESYPTQGNAASIVILGEDGGGEERATLSFELTVEGEPPANAALFGFVPAEGGMSAPLADPDGDGLYTGSMTVDRFGPGPRPVPPGTEPVSLPVQIVQSTGVIKDFGLVRIDGDKTFSASVSFEDDDGGANPGGTSNGGSANGSGTGPGGIRVLPATGGASLTVLGVMGTLLLASGLLVRRLVR
jgi:LPXTG-motif cell wall-anchored protein